MTDDEIVEVMARAVCQHRGYPFDHLTSPEQDGIRQTMASILAALRKAGVTLTGPAKGEVK
jgi:hypothetical protein